MRTTEICDTKSIRLVTVYNNGAVSWNLNSCFINTVESIVTAKPLLVSLHGSIHIEGVGIQGLKRFVRSCVTGILAKNENNANEREEKVTFYQNSPALSALPDSSILMAIYRRPWFLCGLLYYAVAQSGIGLLIGGFIFNRDAICKATELFHICHNETASWFGFKPSWKRLPEATERSAN